MSNCLKIANFKFKSLNPFEPNNSALFFDSQIMFEIDKFDVVIETHHILVLD